MNEKSSPFEAADVALPGLGEEDREPARSLLVDAARRSIAALSASGVLDETHALPCRLLLQLAEAVDVGVRSGKASAAAMAAAQLIATYELLLPAEAKGGETDEWTQLLAELRGSGPPVGNPA